MSTIIQLKQGSPEWLAYRLTMCNASETAAVLGLSPWTTPYQLWLQKTGRKCQAANQAMQHGTDMEPAARAAYEVQTGEIMQPLVLKDGVYSASLDGMTLEGYFGRLLDRRDQMPVSGAGLGALERRG